VRVERRARFFFFPPSLQSLLDHGLLDSIFGKQTKAYLVAVKWNFESGHYKRYDVSKDSTYLMYFDVNNLYGAAMSQCLPYGNFEFMKKFNIEEILNTADDSCTGYILECDLDYPIHLHNLHSDLPLAPEHMVPPSSRSKLKKLLLTLYPKKNYIIHYKNLKVYLQ
jgi:hypothetical protein